MILAFTSVSVVMGSSRVRGFIALFLGLALGTVGIDGQTGQARMVFGNPELMDGIQLTIVLVSLFAIGECFYVASRYSNAPPAINPLSGGLWMNADDWRRSWKPWLRGTALGFPIGALPAGGSEIPTFLSYTLERKLVGESGRVRPWRHRRRRWARGRQQRGRRRYPRAAADAGSADVGDGCDHAGGIPELRPATRADVVRYKRRAGLGTDRVTLHRQRHAARSQSAAGRCLGAPAAGSPALSLRGDHGFRAGRRMGHFDLVVGPSDHGRDRSRGLCHARSTIFPLLQC